MTHGEAGGSSTEALCPIHWRRGFIPAVLSGGGMSNLSLTQSSYLTGHREEMHRGKNRRVSFPDEDGKPESLINEILCPKTV